jgi:hypothetical protein
MREPNTRYDQPIGDLAQRLAGVALGAVAILVAWTIVHEIVQAGWSNQRSGVRIFEILVLAALPWCAITAHRLILGTLASEPLMPPIALIASGAVIGVASCVGALLILTGHATLGDFDVVEGFAIASAAIGFGVRNQRRRSRRP